MSQADRSRRRVLVVDDEPSMRRIMSDILRAEGYPVDAAASGEEAVELCSKERYAVVLMDVRMPGIDGVEAFRRIQRDQKDVRVILMSAYGLDDLKQAALEEGAVAFLDKPLDLEQTVRLIGEAKDATILVVETDESTSELLSNTLRENGYHVTVTKSGREALELVEQIRFDLVFVDVALSSMSGLDLYLAIKRITPTAVVVMIAGMDEEFERSASEAVRHGAYTVVTKPLDIDHILGLLERHTGGDASGRSP